MDCRTQRFPPHRLRSGQGPGAETLCLQSQAVKTKCHHGASGEVPLRPFAKCEGHVFSAPPKRELDMNAGVRNMDAETHSNRARDPIHKLIPAVLAGYALAMSAAIQCILLGR